jgi:hypothetical protein
MRYDRLSPANAPAAAQATIRKMRGSDDPDVATPNAMITVSLGSTGITASRHGSPNAIRYENADPTWRLVIPLNAHPRPHGYQMTLRHHYSQELG